MRQQTRAHSIGVIKASIIKAKEEGKDVEINDIVLPTMANLGLSRRTAREYIQVALFELEKLELEAKQEIKSLEELKIN